MSESLGMFGGMGMYSNPWAAMLSGMSRGFAEAAMPRPYRVPLGAAIGMAAGGMQEGMANAQKMGLQNQMLQLQMQGLQQKAAALKQGDAFMDRLMEPGGPLSGMTTPVGPAIPGMAAPRSNGAEVQGGGKFAGWSPDLTAHVNSEASRLGIPPELARAFLMQENGGDPNAPGGGFGQILASTAAQPGYGVAPISQEDLADPKKNATFALTYFTNKAKANGVDPSQPAHFASALRLYNGGGDPNYVQNVMRYMPGGERYQVAEAGNVASDATPAPAPTTNVQLPGIQGGATVPGIMPNGQPAYSPTRMAVALEMAAYYQGRSGNSAAQSALQNFAKMALDHNRYMPFQDIQGRSGFYDTHTGKPEYFPMDMQSFAYQMGAGNAQAQGKAGFERGPDGQLRPAAGGFSDPRYIATAEAAKQGRVLNADGTFGAIPGSEADAETVRTLERARASGQSEGKAQVDAQWAGLIKGGEDAAVKANKYMWDIADSADAASKQNVTLNTAIQAMDKFPPGIWANKTLYMRQIASFLGMPSEGLAEGELLKSIQAGMQIGQLRGEGQVSNFERSILIDKAPLLLASPGGARLIARYLMSLNQYDINASEYMRPAMRENGSVDPKQIYQLRQDYRKDHPAPTLPVVYTGKPVAMPESKDKLRPGMMYNTPAGVRMWDGETFFEVSQ